MKKYLHIIAIAILMQLPQLIQAQQASRVAQFNIQNKIALQGYDAVAYFTQTKAIKGKNEFAVVAEGITYYFSSIQNKELFKKDVKKYEPQFGG